MILMMYRFVMVNLISLSKYNLNFIIKYYTKNSISCIYKIPYHNYGQTSKPLKTREYQHKYNVTSANISTAKFLHYQKFNNLISWKDSKIF